MALQFYKPVASNTDVLLGAAVTRQEPVVGSHGAIKFDEYASIQPKDERRRLTDFAIQLKAQPNTVAYIIAYGGSRSWSGEAQCRASRAKSYLAQTQGIRPDRIVTIDGGYRQEATTELYIKLQGGEPPTAFPTLDPKSVRITNTKQKCPSLQRTCSTRK